MVRVGLVQLQIRTNRVEDNLDRAAKYVEQAAQQGCDLVVLPESFSTGLDLPRCHERATAIPGPSLEWIAGLALAHHVHVCAGFLEAEESSVYSTVVLVDDEGRLLSRYRRICIYDLESYFLSSGTESVIVETKLGRLGFIVGYDIQFPETMRTLFSESVEIVVCPAILLRQFAQSIRQMALARVAENCCYLLFCSATGENTLAGLTYLGHSMVLQSPVGLRPYSQQFKQQDSILSEATEREQLLVADLDVDSLRRLQTANPLSRDFRRSRFCQSRLVASRGLQVMSVVEPR